MALSKTITIKDNFGDDKTFQNAYIQVADISGGKQGMQILVNTLKEDKSHVISQATFNFKPSLEGKNFIAQAYDHIKTFPAYAGAVDC
jgi:hypothetical protein